MDFRLLPLAFSLILTVASRLLHPYSTDNKTCRLIVEKILHSEGHPEFHRVTWRRGRREIELTRKEEGESKGERAI